MSTEEHLAHYGFTVAFARQYINEKVAAGDFAAIFHGALNINVTSRMLAEIVEIYTAEFIETFFTSIGFDGSALREVVELSQGAETTTGDTAANTFAASQETLGEGDVIDGGAGLDVFNYSSTGSGPVTHSGFTLQNIETFNITSNASGGTSFDLSSSSGIEKVVIEPSTSDITLISEASMPLLDLTAVDQNSRFITLEGAKSLTFTSTAGATSSARRLDTVLNSDRNYSPGSVTDNPAVDFYLLPEGPGGLSFGLATGGDASGAGLSAEGLENLETTGSGDMALGSIANAANNFVWDATGSGAVSANIQQVSDELTLNVTGSGLLSVNFEDVAKAFVLNATGSGPLSVDFQQVADDLTLNVTSSGLVSVNFEEVINQLSLAIIGSGNTTVLGMGTVGTIDGSAATGNLTLAGSTGSDVFKSGLGNDSFEGLSGADRFEFGSGWGQDTVQDFTVNTDKIVFEEAVFFNFADMLNHTSQSGTSVVIQDGTNSLTLAGTSVTNLVTGDFQFGNGVVDTVGATVGTASAVSEGSSVAGNIDYANDQDWYAITLSVGNTYTFSIAGDDTFGSALSNPSVLLNNSSGDMIGPENFGENSSDTSIIYTPTISDVYYIAANGLNATTGSFLLDVQATAVDTVGATVGTASTVSLGSAVTGNIDYANDQDWYAITLSANTVYNFALQGSATAAGTLSNPELHLYDSLGSLVRSDYDGGAGTNASLNYGPTISGQYYISTQDALSATGSYKLDVNAYSSPLQILNVNDSLPTIYDIDRYPGVALSAGVYYEIDVKGVDSGYGTFSDPKVSIHNDDLSFFRSDSDGGIGNDASLGLVIEETGIYAINVTSDISGGSQSDDAGTYQLSIVGYSATSEIWG